MSSDIDITPLLYVTISTGAVSLTMQNALDLDDEGHTAYLTSREEIENLISTLQHARDTLFNLQR